MSKKIIVLSVAFLFCVMYLSASPAKDTITVRLETSCKNFLPERYTYYPPADSPAKSMFIDSLRVGGKAFNGDKKRYYLIVYDVNGIKRLEGNFHDERGDGHCIHYDPKGRKHSEGTYEWVCRHKYNYFWEFISFGKYIYIGKKGKWTYYNKSGKVRKTKIF